MTDLIIFLSWDNYEDVWRGWKTLKNSYCIVQAKVAPENKKIGRVIFIDDEDRNFTIVDNRNPDNSIFNKAINAFYEVGGPFDQRSVLIQHGRTASGVRNSQKAAVEASWKNGASYSLEIKEYTRATSQSDSNVWPDINRLAGMAEEVDTKEVKDGQATSLAGKLLIKYDVWLKFRLLDQIAAELILKSFGQNANAGDETEKFLDPEKHPIWASWSDELRKAYEKVQPTQNAPEVLVGFLGVANAEAVKYLKEINPQQATSE